MKHTLYTNVHGNGLFHECKKGQYYLNHLAYGCRYSYQDGFFICVGEGCTFKFPNLLALPFENEHAQKKYLNLHRFGGEIEFQEGLVAIYEY